MIPLTLESAKEAYRKAGMEPESLMFFGFNKNGRCGCLLGALMAASGNPLDENTPTQVVCAALGLGSAEAEQITEGFDMGFDGVKPADSRTDLFNRAFSIGAALRSEREEKEG